MNVVHSKLDRCKIHKLLVDTDENHQWCVDDVNDDGVSDGVG